MELNESTLGRVWQFAENGKYLFAILTAFRGEHSREENLERNKVLQSNIRKEGFGFFKLEGYWVENKGTENELDVVEDSFFISLPANTPNAQQKLVDFTLSQVKQFNQDGAVVKLNPIDNVVSILGKDGGTFNIGSFSPQKIAQAYSKLKKENRTFVFESAQAPKSWINAVYEQKLNLIFPVK
jgi:hypothetical protein